MESIDTTVSHAGMTDSSGAFTLVAPLPPTLNQSYHSYPVGGHCRLVMSDAARAWKDEVAYHVRCFWHAFGQAPPLRATYELRMTQFLTRRSRDVDGNVKLVMDSIFNGIDVNDNRVRRIVLDRVVDKAGIPRIVVVVEWYA